jgi:hypothetical protein
MGQYRVMARKLHEGAPPTSDEDMGGKDFGLTGDTDSWRKRRGVNPDNIPKHKEEAEKMRKVHPKRV